MSNETEIHRQRLLNVVRALRESPRPEAFRMDWFGYGPDEKYPCGTPMCALGHYAARGDLQSFCALSAETGNLCRADNAESHTTSQEEAAHFGVTEQEYIALFGPSGCGDAQTIEDAARFIELFVERKYALTALQRSVES